MIIDQIERANSYAYLGEGFEKAMNFLYDHRNGDLELGRYEISDDDYAMVQSYETKPIEECHFEAHKRYIDVQYSISGSEGISWALTDHLHQADYDEKKDFIRLEGKGDIFPLTAGNFFILFPSDAHQPKIMIGKSEQIRKIVLKIRIR
jgi:YhcH/YjgK/YiaL family protein